MSRMDLQNVNPLIVEYLSIYEPDVQQLALQAFLGYGSAAPVQLVVETFSS